MLSADSYSSIYVGQSLVSMVSPQPGFDLLLVAIVTLVKIPLGFPPKLKMEVAKMVGCMLCATLHSKHTWENLMAILRSFNSYFLLPYYVFFLKYFLEISSRPVLLLTVRLWPREVSGRL